MRNRKLSAASPKYVALAEILRKKYVESSIGTAIPSERRLAEEYEVSRMTARRAVGLLEEQGLLERYVGRGTFTVHPKIQLSLSLSSFTADMKERGLTPGARLLKATTGTSEAYGLESEFAPGTKLACIERLRTADGDAIAIETSFLRSEAVPGIERLEKFEGSLYELLNNRYGIVFDAGEQVISVCVIDESEAGVLNVKLGSPGFAMKRRCFARGELVECSHSVYRTDIYEIKAKIIGRPEGI